MRRCDLGAPALVVITWPRRRPRVVLATTEHVRAAYPGAIVRESVPLEVVVERVLAARETGIVGLDLRGRKLSSVQQALVL